MHEMVQGLAAHLLEDEFFRGFKLRKRDSSLILKTNFGNRKVEVQNWLDRQEAIIVPIYSVRFDRLHEWFEHFSFKTIRDQRDSYTVGFDGGMLGGRREYRIPMSGYTTAEMGSLKDDIIENSRRVFDEFNTTGAYYRNTVLPVLRDRSLLPDVGADWIFEYLYAARLHGESDYDPIKAAILHRVDELNDRGEPNVTRYYENLDAIVAFLENEASR